MKSKVAMTIVAFILSWEQAASQFVWQKHPENPVLRSWTGNVDEPNRYKYAFGPTVFVDQAGAYHMWFTSLALGTGASLCVSEALSLDGVQWFASLKNPVLRPGSSGAFDERGVYVQTVIKESTGYKMYYLGVSNAGIGAIGLATSSDGRAWTKFVGNPVIQPGGPSTWDSYQAVMATVSYDSASYSMWYTGHDGTTLQIGLATSPDGISWTKYPGNPILQPGPTGTWDHGSVQSPMVVKVGSIYHMFYDGVNLPIATSPIYIGHALSTDGVNWTKYSGNPILSPGNGSAWDGYRLSSMSVIFRAGRFHMWYSGLESGSQYWQTGYATADSALLNQVPQPAIPLEFSLQQSYPNPFNPSTTIVYHLPTQTHVTLNVYDILGREVAVLVDGVQTPGIKTIQFNAATLSSGVYFYRIKTADFTRSKKMLLTK